METCLKFVCFFVMTYSVEILKADTYHFSYWIQTQHGGDYNIYSFETSLGSGIVQCIDTCKANTKCKFINFQVRTHACYHIDARISENITVEKKAGFVFGDKAEWNMTEYESCESCIDGALCSTCESSGCPYPEEKNKASLLGNMFSTGSNITYKCTEGYDLHIRDTPIVSKCLENGHWTLTDFLCLPEGSREFNGSLYNLITETKNWYDAKENCESLGGNLTDIRSSAEQDFIIELFDVYVKVWTGGSNAVDENTFSWLDGSAVSSGYTNWAPNQPWHPCGGIRCISVLQTWSYRWNDEACDNKMRSVCKFS